MKSFRAEYGAGVNLLENDDFSLEVIGYRAPLSLVWKGMNTVPSHRLMIFHDPVAIDFGNQSFETQRESIIFLPAHVSVAYGRSDNNWTHSWVRFTGEYFPSLLRQQSDLIGRPLPLRHAQAWEPWLLGLYYEKQRVPRPDSQIISYLLQLWARNLHHEGSNPGESTNLGGEPDRLVLAKNRLEAHYRSQDSTSYLARLAGMGESYFCACFKERWGKTPLEYRLDLRLRQARELLRETAFPIGTVGELCGFPDSFYFSRIFKRETGLSPLSFRKKTLPRPPL